MRATGSSCPEGYHLGETGRLITNSHRAEGSKRSNNHVDRALQRCRAQPSNPGGGVGARGGVSRLKGHRGRRRATGGAEPGAALSLALAVRPAAAEGLQHPVGCEDARRPRPPPPTPRPWGTRAAGAPCARPCVGADVSLAPLPTQLARCRVRKTFLSRLPELFLLPRATAGPSPPSTLSDRGAGRHVREARHGAGVHQADGAAPGEIRAAVTLANGLASQPQVSCRGRPTAPDSARVHSLPPGGRPGVASPVVRR